MCPSRGCACALPRSQMLGRSSNSQFCGAIRVPASMHTRLEFADVEQQRSYIQDLPSHYHSALKRCAACLRVWMANT